MRGTQIYTQSFFSFSFALSSPSITVINTIVQCTCFLPFKVGVAKATLRTVSEHACPPQTDPVAASIGWARVRDKLTPSTSFFANSRTLMGCTDPLRQGRRTPSVSSRVGSLPRYADVRLHIPMTHRNDVIRYRMDHMPLLIAQNKGAEGFSLHGGYVYIPRLAAL